MFYVSRPFMYDLPLCHYNDSSRFSNYRLLQSSHVTKPRNGTVPLESYNLAKR